MAINLDLIGKELEPIAYQYTWKDAVLYALGIGATPKDLNFVYENAKFKVYPTFAVIPAFEGLVNVVGKLKVNPMMLLHGEQKIVLHQPFPKQGKIQSIPKVEAIYDKEKAALVVGSAKSFLEDGTHICDNIFKLYCRGEGNFGGEKGPKEEVPVPPEGKEPDFTIEYPTQETQALLYRLSGDYNPLHADPGIAKMGGFDKPILHGLCTYGFTGRGILEAVCDNDPAKFKSFSARFSKPVFPGEKILIKGWKLGDKQYVVETSSERGEVVLTHGVVELN